MISPVGKSQIYTILSESPKSPVMQAQDPMKPVVSPHSLSGPQGREQLTKANIPVQNFPNFNNLGSKIDIKV